MVKAEQQHSSHRYLDKAVIRIALTDARKLMLLGCSASDAAGISHAWSVGGLPERSSDDASQAESVFRVIHNVDEAFS